MPRSEENANESRILMDKFCISGDGSCLGRGVSARRIKKSAIKQQQSVQPH